MIKFKEIFEGWRNHLYPPDIFREKILEVSRERMEICRKCEYNSVNAPSHTWLTDIYEHCIECGCPLIAKTKCLSCGCGWKKWHPVLTEEEEEEINEQRD